MDGTALALAIILFIVGIVGTVLPALPGPILVYGGMLLYGFMTDFETLDMYFFIMQSVVLALVFATDYVSSSFGTKLFGGSRQASIGAFVGTIVALIFLGPLGIIIGPFLGAVLVELLRGVAFANAIQIGFGTLIGLLGGMIFKLFALTIMIIYFFIAIF